LESNAYLQHEDVALSAIAYELLTTPYELSEGWWNKYQVLVPDKQRILHKDILSATMRLKQYHNIEQIKQLEKMLQEETDLEKQIELMRKLQILNNQRKEFSAETGTVVFRPEFGG